MTDQDARTVELEAEIEEQRERLADTIDQIGNKLDVKKQARIRLRRLQPDHVVMAVGIAIVLGALVAWKRSG
jgi:hypothetical protein